MRERLVRRDFSSSVIEPVQELLLEALESCRFPLDGMVILKERAAANLFSFLVDENIGQLIEHAAENTQQNVNDILNTLLKEI